MKLTKKTWSYLAVAISSLNDCPNAISPRIFEATVSKFSIPTTSKFHIMLSYKMYIYNV